MANFKKKPTIKEVASSVLYLKQQLDMVGSMTQELEKAFSLYVEMKNDGKNFEKFIDKKVKEWKENDAKANGNADKPNLQGDTDGESSGSKRVRKKKG
jgi:hypothetical protein